MVSVAAAVPSAACVPVTFGAPEASLVLATVYDVQPAPAPVGERSVMRGDTVLEQPIRPRGQFELAGSAPLPDEAPMLAEGSATLASGSRLFEVLTVSSIVGCAVPSADPAGQWLPCLVDQDRDGRFEALFFGRNGDVPLPTIGGNMPLDRLGKLPEPVGYRRLDPASPGEPMSVSIRRSSRFDLLGRKHFEIWVQRAGASGRLPGTVAFTPSDDPVDMSVMDARLRVRSGQDGAILVTALEPIPARPLNMPDVRKDDWMPIPMPR